MGNRRNPFVKKTIETSSLAERIDKAFCSFVKRNLASCKWICFVFKSLIVLARLKKLLLFFHLKL